MSVSGTNYTDEGLLSMARVMLGQGHSIARMLRLVVECCCQLADPAGAAKIRRWWGL